MKLSILFLSLLLSLSAWSVTGKVNKVKGKSAILTIYGPVGAGDLVTTGDLGETDGGDDKATGRAVPVDKYSKRDYAFSYNWQSLAVTTTIGSSSTNSTSHTGNISFWVVFGHFKVAPIFAYTTTVNVSSDNHLRPAIGQYDFVKNQTGVSLVPGVYLLAQTSSISANTGISDTKTPRTTPSVVVDRWIGFPLAKAYVALSFRLEYDSISNPSITSLTVTQFNFISGAKVYFFDKHCGF